MSDDAVTVRQARPADLLDVHRIETRTFPQPWPYAAFIGFVGEPGFLVAETGDEIVGYVVTDSVPNYGRDIGHVKDLAVVAEARGQGIGRRLLARALDVLAAQGVGQVKLEVRETNDPAIALYREFGFTFRRKVPGYYSNGEAALVLVREMG